MGDFDKNLQLAIKKIEKNIQERNKTLKKFEEMFKIVNNFWNTQTKTIQQKSGKDASVGTQQEEEKISLCVFKGTVIKDKKYLKKPNLRINFCQKSETCKNILVRSISKTINFPR